MNKILEFVDQLKNIKLINIVDVCIAIVLIFVFWNLSRLIAYITVRIVKGKTIEKQKIKDEPLYNPIKWFIRATGFYIAVLILQIPDNFRDITLKVYKIACIIIVAKGVANLFHPKAVIFKKLEEKTNYSGDKALNTFVSKVIKFVVYIIAGYIIILELGYDLGGLATGLGISGVVFAFAAQDLVKNIFSSMAIIVDKPFLVGNTIETSHCTGTVIDITFRSTRIRAIDHTVVTIPNSVIATETVKNWSRIKRRNYNTTLNIPLETPRIKVEKLIKKISFVLKANEAIVPETLQVHFETIEKSAIQISIVFDTIKVKYNEYELFEDKINLDIIEILDSENIKLAYPSNNIYIKSNGNEGEKNDEEEGI